MGGGSVSFDIDVDNVFASVSSMTTYERAPCVCLHFGINMPICLRLIDDYTRCSWYGRVVRDMGPSLQKAVEMQ